MTKKDQGPQTGKDFANLARKRGAKISINRGFTSIETPKGKVMINETNDRLDSQTRSNLRKWFRLLGLMIFIVLCVIPIIKSFL